MDEPSQLLPGAPSFSRTLRKGWDSTAVSRMGFSEPHDPPFPSHFSCTALTDTKSQSRNNSPTVQHRKLCPSPETDPKSAAKPVSAASLTTCRQAVKAVNSTP